jgi:hypothetical protein
MANLPQVISCMNSASPDPDARCADRTVIRQIYEADTLGEARSALWREGTSGAPAPPKGVAAVGLSSAVPSAATGLSVWEINYLLAKLTVGR